MDQFLREYFESGLFSVRLREAAERIAPYVRKDPTAFCTWEDHLQAVDTLEQVCLLRAESARGQLEGKIPGTFRGQQEDPGAGRGRFPYRFERTGRFLKIWNRRRKELPVFIMEQGNPLACRQVLHYNHYRYSAGRRSGRRSGQQERSR